MLIFFKIYKNDRLELNAWSTSIPRTSSLSSRMEAKSKTFVTIYSPGGEFVRQAKVIFIACDS
ncbi:hypothetical protein Plhal304r1_c004g0017781 [Plasmopara halstedii]